MPIYEYECRTHGRFEVLVLSSMGAAYPCPTCRMPSARVMSALARVKVVHRRRLRYGEGAPNKIINRQETGGSDILVLSDGALEQEEVDYIAQGAVEKEQSRVRKGRSNETKERLGQLVKLAENTRPGKRAAAIKEAMADGIRYV